MSYLLNDILVSESSSNFRSLFGCLPLVIWLLCIWPEIICYCLAQLANVMFCIWNGIPGSNMCNIFIYISKFQPIQVILAINSSLLSEVFIALIACGGC